MYLISDYCMPSSALCPCFLLAIYLGMLHMKFYSNMFLSFFPISLIQYNQSEIVKDHLLEMNPFRNFPEAAAFSVPERIPYLRISMASNFRKMTSAELVGSPKYQEHKNSTHIQQTKVY